jgi:uncharacterized membrane protein YraQ (UPF0718 family)
VTGTPAFPTAAATILPAFSGEERRAAPAPPAVTFLTGQPMLMSTKSNPIRLARKAASAISPGSAP